MKTVTQKLGKVSITVEKDPHSLEREYDRLVIVNDIISGKTYISRKPVPVNTQLTNREYWIPTGALDEQVILDYNTFKQTIEDDILNMEIDIAQYKEAISEAEALRVVAESGRVSAETNRVNSETNRRAAETSRVNAETNRVNAEASRAQAETQRQTNEELREQNEGNPSDTPSSTGSRWARFKKAESDRQTSFATNELARQTTFEEAQTSNAEEFSSAQSNRTQTFNESESSRAQSFTEAQNSRSETFNNSESSRAETFNESQTSRAQAYNQAENARDTLYSSAEQNRNSQYSSAETSRDTQYASEETSRNSQYQVSEGTYSDSELGDNSRWGKYKQAEESRNAVVNSIRDNLGYFVCDTAEGTPSKVVSSANYNLIVGGSIKIKFIHKNTANSPTLKIGSAEAKPLYYNGSIASSTNSWSDNEIVDLYYDGTNYRCNPHLNVDNEPTSGSDNLVKSGGVKGLFDSQYSESTVDFAILDENNNAIMALNDGHIKTKKFDSRKSITTDDLECSYVSEQEYTDFIISDDEGNPIVSFADGHIKTKKFDSKHIEVGNLTRQIKDVETEISGLGNRVLYLESLPSVNVETLFSNIITRCSEIFAPLGQAEVSYIPKKKFKILFIGNSVTQDHTGYLPWLFRQLYANDVDFTIGNFYYAGRTIKEYVQDFIKPDDPWKAQLYTVAHNTHEWTEYRNTKTLADVVSSENWDFISIQAYMQRSAAEDLSKAPQLVEWLRNNCPSPFELCYLMPQCFSSDSVKKSTRDAALTIIKDNPVSVLFAPYFCMEEAQKYWQVAGVLSPEDDGTHLREGFPVMITGMHIMDVLCRRLGLPSRVLKNHLIMTSAINDTLGGHGANGTVDDTMATDANYINVQYCTVQGTKQTEAWFNKAINELIINYN